MKRHFILILAAGLLILNAVALAESTTYGKNITLTEQTKISDILAAPDSYVGKKVLVSGIIVDVCEHRGCWMMLAGDKPHQKIRVKVKDGEMVFPLTAKGKKARVEGEVVKLHFPAKGASQCGRHAEKGEKHSCAATGTVYQIQVSGAVIE